MEESNKGEYRSSQSFKKFLKAFVSVQREAMWKSLWSYRIPEKVIKMIKAMYEGLNVLSLNQV